MPNLLVNAVTTYDNKGLKKAKKDINGFDKSVKKLGKSFVGLFAAQKILSYGKASVKAFVQDDKAAKILGKSLDNLGVAYANPAIKDYIGSLESQFGVLDDKLRPAYQKLLTTTGDWRRSQDLLKTALDLSAMSGSDVVSVSGDLAKAYAGNTRGLLKYGLGLSKTELAAMSFEEILVQIAKVSGGQATLAANTYSGSLDKLNVAAANASETIGKGLVQALTEVSGANGLDGALKGINDFASGISDAIIGAERLAKIMGFFVYNTKGTNPITQMNEFNAANAKSDMLSRQKYGGAAASKYIAEADKAAALKLAKQKKEELVLLSAKNKQTRDEAQMKKDQAALDELKKKFDLERIGLNAALNQATDEETKARIRAQIAILDETGKTAQAANDALVKAQAEKVVAEIKAAASLNNLALAAFTASTNITKWASVLEQTKESTGNAGGTLGKPYAGGPAAVIADNSGAIGAQGGGTVTDSQKWAEEIAVAADEWQTKFDALLKTVPGGLFDLTGFTDQSLMYAGIDWSQYGFDSSGAATGTSGTGGGAVTVTIVDNTSGLIEIVQDAVVTNSRYGNSLTQAGAV